MGLGLSHDSSGVLLRDGAPFVGIQLERLTRVKHDGLKHRMGAVIDYLLNAAGVGLSDLDAIAVSDPYLELPQQLNCGPIDLAAGNVLHVGHHLAHAYSAFGPSGFPDATVIVVDGHGDYYYEDRSDRLAWGPDVARDVITAYGSTVDTSKHPVYETESVYSFDRHAKPVLRSRGYMRFGRRRGYTQLHWDPLAIGQNYRQVAEWLFGTGKAAGKVMGLASYATGRHKFPDCFKVVDGVPVLTDEWKAEVRLALTANPDIRLDYAWAADLAGHVQVATETLLLRLVREGMSEGSSRYLCMAGGVALNATTNGRIEREVLTDGFFVQPASSDAGLSVGAANAAVHELTGSVPIGQPPADEWGRRYSESDYEDAVAGFAQRGWTVTRPTLTHVAERIADGGVIGLVDGGSELGPRALGHRSILADPRRLDMRDRLNLEIKKREWFRPFAPAVLEEHLENWFEPGGASLYMLSTTTVRKERRDQVPAITHVDGTARVQVLATTNEGTLRKLVTHFFQATGIPIILNTSFNLAGEPIVETPHDALDAFDRMPLDHVFLGGFLVSR